MIDFDNPPVFITGAERITNTVFDHICCAKIRINNDEYIVRSSRWNGLNKLVPQLCLTIFEVPTASATRMAIDIAARCRHCLEKFLGPLRRYGETVRVSGWMS